MTLCTTHEDFTARQICELTERVETLEGRPVFDPPELLAVFDNAGAFATLTLTILLILTWIGMALFIWRRREAISELSLTVGDASVSVKSAAQKVSQLLQDVQSQVIDMVGNRMQGMAQERNVFSGGKPLPAPPTKPLAILWVTDDTDIILFEKAVITRLGNTIDQVPSTAEAIDRLSNGYRYDLILSDITREDEKRGGLYLFYTLKDGVKVGVSANNRVAKIGEAMRFAIYSTPDKVGRYADVIETDDSFATASFGYLVARIKWLQETKAKPPKVEEAAKAEDAGKDAELDKGQ